MPSSTSSNSAGSGSDSPRGDVTRLLDAASRGDPRAVDQLLPVVYDELRRLATGLMRHERAGHTLQPTALVHEAYLRLIGPANVGWQNRAHFFGAAALAMRRILIDGARHVRATRVERRAAPLDSRVVESASIDVERDADDLIYLDAAMESLKTKDARQHEVVMLRYFAGLTIDQAAQALGMSPGTVKNDWSFARAWLIREMDRQRAAAADPAG